MWFDSVRNPFDIANAANKSLGPTDSAIGRFLATASDGGK